MDWPEIARLAPIGGGVYFVWAGEVSLYIGQSFRMRRRLQTHDRRAEFISNGATRVTWVEIPNRSERIKREAKMLMEYGPMLCVRDTPSASAYWARQGHVRALAMAARKYEKSEALYRRVA